MDIDYNKIKIFLTITRCKGITAAAKVLHRTQSAISQALYALEKQLGVKLITWEGKQMKLTHEGKRVYQAANDKIKALDEQLLAITTAGEEVAGSIEIGMLHDSSSRIEQHVFDAVAEFRKQYPTVTFTIHFGTSAKIEQALLDRELDIGFLINFQSLYRFSIFEMTTEEHIIVTSPQYIERQGVLKSIHDVVCADLIDIDKNFTCFSPWVQYHDPKAFQSLQKKLPVIVVPDFVVIKELVLSGQGIAVMPAYLIEKEVKKGTAVQVLPDLQTLRVWVSCAIEGGRETRLCEQLFLQSLKNNICL